MFNYLFYTDDDDDVHDDDDDDNKVIFLCIYCNKLDLLRSCAWVRVCVRAYVCVHG